MSLTLRLVVDFFVLDNIGSDGSAEDSGKRVGRAAGFAIAADDADSRTSGHLERLLWD